MDLTGRNDCLLHYRIGTELQPDGDAFFVEASLDGQNWAELARFTGSMQGYVRGKTRSLAGFAGNPQVHLRFRLQSDATGGGDGVYLDDITVECIADQYSGIEYDFYDGTSMASPHVAGIAALLFSASPQATPQQVKDAIMQTVDPEATLQGKTVTGGRVNAFNALRRITGQG